MNILSIDPGLKNGAICHLVASLLSGEESSNAVTTTTTTAAAAVNITISLEILDWKLLDCRNKKIAEEFEQAKKAKEKAMINRRIAIKRAATVFDEDTEITVKQKNNDEGKEDVVVVERRKKRRLRKIAPPVKEDEELRDTKKLVDKLRKKLYVNFKAVDFFNNFINQMPKPSSFIYDQVIIERQGFPNSKVADVAHLTFGYYAASQCPTIFSKRGSFFWLIFTTKGEEEEMGHYSARKKRSVAAALEICQPGVGLIATHKASGNKVKFILGSNNNDNALKIIESFQKLKKQDDLADALLQGLGAVYNHYFYPPPPITPGK